MSKFIACNSEIKEVHYNGYTISKIYACGGELVYSGETPPIPTDKKLYMVDNTGGTYTLECDGGNLIEHTMKNFEYNDGVSSQTIVFLSYQQKRSIVSAVIGTCVTGVEGSIFSGFTSLSSVTIPNTVTNMCGDGEEFKGCTSLEYINIPDSVDCMGGHIFQDCTNLKGATIGSGVTEISNYAFSGCVNMEYITIKAPTPPDILFDTFNDSNNCPIYVPQDSVEIYKTFNVYWEYYAPRIQAIT